MGDACARQLATGHTGRGSRITREEAASRRDRHARADRRQYVAVLDLQQPIMRLLPWAGSLALTDGSWSFPFGRRSGTRRRPVDGARWSGESLTLRRVAGL